MNDKRTTLGRIYEVSGTKLHNMCDNVPEC